MDIEQIKRELRPGLNPIFKYEIDYVNNLTELLLIILDYSPGNDKPPASFALSLQHYHEGQFPPKCWMTHNKFVKINDDGPNPHDDYKKFSYRENRFYPFSVNLSSYTPKNTTSIKNIIDKLYKHIEF